jgi:hypothetical protein
MLNGLAYLLKGDWDSMLTVQSEGIAKSVVRRFAPRVGLSLLLVALAFILPAILDDVVKDAGTFQASLLIAAGFALIAPDAKQAAVVARSFGLGAGKDR